MYPVAEFRKVALRAVNRRALTVLAAIVSSLAIVVTAADLCDPWGTSDPLRRIELTWITLAAVGLTLVFEVLAVRARHPFTRCPHCHGGLTANVPLVVASGRCPRCGNRVLAPPADDSPADALIPRADFLAADTFYQTRGVPVLIGGLMACYIGFAAAMVTLNWSGLPFPLNVAAFVPVLLVAPVSLAAVLRVMWAGGKRNPALACPACGALLAGSRMLTAATGCCHQCGGKVIVPRTRPLPPPHLGPLWTVSRLLSVTTERRRAWWSTLKRDNWLLWSPMVAGHLTGWMMFWFVQANLGGWRWLNAVSYSEREWWSAAVGLLVCVLLWTFGVRWRSSAIRKMHPIDCPRCGREFLPAFALATRCCSRCGWRIVAE